MFRILWSAVKLAGAARALASGGVLGFPMPHVFVLCVLRCVMYGGSGAVFSSCARVRHHGHACMMDHLPDSTLPTRCCEVYIAKSARWPDAATCHD